MSNVSDIPEHYLPGEHIERERSNIEITVVDVKPVDRFCNNVTCDSAVVVCDVHNPENSRNKAAKQPNEVAVHFEIFEVYRVDRGVSSTRDTLEGAHCGA